MLSFSARYIKQSIRIGENVNLRQQECNNCNINLKWCETQYQGKRNIRISLFMKNLTLKKDDFINNDDHISSS